MTIVRYVISIYAAQQMFITSAFSKSATHVNYSVAFEQDVTTQV